MSYRIRAALAGDAPLLPAIEQAAGELYRTYPELAWLADGDNVTEAVHLARIAQGTTWVAEGDDGRLLGFLSAGQQDRALFIFELSVAPEAQRQGIGSALIAAASTYAATQKLNEVTLTTFVDVPWNAPYYEKIGFERLADADLGVELAEHLTREAEAGFQRERRCAMRKPV